MWVGAKVFGDVGIFPGFAEFGAAGGFFGGDAELFADAVVDLLEVLGDGTEIVAEAAVFVDVVNRRKRALSEF